MNELPVGEKKRRRWKEILLQKKEDRTWWLVKLDFKNSPDIYHWLCETAAAHGVSVAKLAKLIIQDAMTEEKRELRPGIQAETASKG